jgi:hypothetical protein
LAQVKEESTCEESRSLPEEQKGAARRSVSLGTDRNQFEGLQECQPWDISTNFLLFFSFEALLISISFLSLREHYVQVLFQEAATLFFSIRVQFHSYRSAGYTLGKLFG